MWIFIVIFPITYFFLLNEDFHHAVGGGKIMCMVRWGGIVRVLILSLAMFIEVCMKRI